EVGPGHPGALSGPRQRVDAKVALQVQQRPPGNLADLLDLIGPQPGAAGLESFQVVEAGGLVDGGPLIPERSVGSKVVVHAHTLRSSASRSCGCVQEQAPARPCSSGFVSCDATPLG